MIYRKLGKSGVKVSVVGLGTNRLGSQNTPQAEVNRIIDHAQELGINHLDSANAYQDGNTEIVLGNAIKGKRDKFFLATKFFFPVGEGPNDRGASRYHIFNAVEASLTRLQSDHIDLYYVHRWDVDTPIEETLRALDDLIRIGKVRYIGASDFAAWQLAKANLLAEFKGWSAFTAIQSHYHILERTVEREVLPYCRSENMAFIPYFPLAGGFLTGKYKAGQPAPAGSRGESSEYVQQYMTPENFNLVEKLTAWANAQGHEMNEFAIAWLLAQPQVASVISGATRMEQVLLNARAADWELSADEIKEVSAILG
ncbi:MAG: aldo/keto reductase [Chloroflexi bacterium HGW-Chloroflexi-10]|nr:MAG: aldo/keto reductase [Chloroflexi bacterium HGW-Chloroflexi-10]